MRQFPPFLAALLLSGVAAQAVAQQQLQLTPEQRQALQARWKAADSNNDGYIDRSEANASLPRVAKAFDHLDTNKDGKLAAEEMQALASRSAGRRH
ncbi:MAG: EF-hand domain-containing protein [Pseudoxanthomonas sp.]